jgi:hypothetical protein
MEIAGRFSQLNIDDAAFQYLRIRDISNRCLRMGHRIELVSQPECEVMLNYDRSNFKTGRSRETAMENGS